MTVLATLLVPTAATASEFSDQQIRTAFVDFDGRVWAKDGVHSTWTRIAGRGVEVRLDGDRIFLHTDDGRLFVKEGSLEASWLGLADRVESFQVEGNRIAFVQTGTNRLYVKEGHHGSWIHVADAGRQYQLEGDRIFVLGNDNVLRGKIGSISARWTRLADRATSFQADGQRIAFAQQRTNRLYVKDSADLNGRWVHVSSAKSQYILDRNRIIVRSSTGATSVKVGALNARWTLLATTADHVVSDNGRYAFRQAGTGRLYARVGSNGANVHVGSAGTAIGITENTITTLDADGTLRIKAGPGLNAQWTTLTTMAASYDVVELPGLAAPTSLLRVESTSQTVQLETAEQAADVLGHNIAVHGDPVMLPAGQLFDAGCTLAGLSTMSRSALVAVFDTTCIAAATAQAYDKLNSPYVEVQAEGLIGAACIVSGGVSSGTGLTPASAFCTGFDVGGQIAALDQEEQNEQFECFPDCSTSEIIRIFVPFW